MVASRVKKAMGFTLMEVIGVMAVIAIIAAVATPRIFEAIEDAKVTSMVSMINDLKANVADYYKDTGRWPRHIPTHADNRYHNLMINDAGGGAAIPGWDGPYLESELSNPITTGAYMDLAATSATQLACDLGGDGTTDGSFLTLRVDGVSEGIARKISAIIDKDSDVTTGNGSWKAAGRVKQYNGNHASIISICITSI